MIFADVEKNIKCPPSRHAKRNYSSFGKIQLLMTESKQTQRHKCFHEVLEKMFLQREAKHVFFLAKPIKSALRLIVEFSKHDSRGSY